MELNLRDGRVLGFAEYGDPGGVPVCFFHGLPGCRLEASLASDVAARSGIRLIAIDRPGFGLSSFRPYSPLIRFAHDIAEVANHRGTDRFATVGVSAGGPFALAAAAALPDRVSSVATVAGYFVPGSERLSGMTPELRASLVVARVAPWLVRPLVALTARAVRRPNSRFVQSLARRSPAPDHELLRDPEIRTQLLDVFREAFRRGARGVAWEQRLLVRDWGFTPGSLRVPVTVWQGGVDRNVPANLGRALASSIPGARLELHENEGHLSLVHNRIGDVLLDVARSMYRRDGEASEARCPTDHCG